MYIHALHKTSRVLLFSGALVAFFVFVQYAHAITNTQSVDLEMTSTQYLSITDANQSGLDLSGDLSFEMWVKPESAPSTGNGHILISKWGTNDRAYYFYYVDDGSKRLHLQVAPTPNAATKFTWDVDLGTDTWKHLAVTFDASAVTAELFVDGESQGTPSWYGNTFDGDINNSSTDFRIGGNLRTAYEDEFDGLVDEVRVWDDIRTQSEIENNMFETLVGTESNLVGYWELNSTSTDKTSNDNDLTLNGSPSYSEEIPYQLQCTVSTGQQTSTSTLVSTVTTSFNLSFDLACTLDGWF